MQRPHRGIHSSGSPPLLCLLCGVPRENPHHERISGSAGWGVGGGQGVDTGRLGHQSHSAPTRLDPQALRLRGARPQGRWFGRWSGRRWCIWTGCVGPVGGDRGVCGRAAGGGGHIRPVHLYAPPPLVPGRTAIHTTCGTESGLTPELVGCGTGISPHNPPPRGPTPEPSADPCHHTANPGCRGPDPALGVTNSEPPVTATHIGPKSRISLRMRGHAGRAYSGARRLIRGFEDPGLRACDSSRIRPMFRGTAQAVHDVSMDAGGCPGRRCGRSS